MLRVRIFSWLVVPVEMEEPELFGLGTKPGLVNFISYFSLSN